MPRNTVMIEPEVKSRVDAILRGMGLNAQQAIAMMYYEIDIHKKLPFENNVPNSETLEAMDDYDARRNLGFAENSQDLFKQLEM